MWFFETRFVKCVCDQATPLGNESRGHRLLRKRSRLLTKSTFHFSDDGRNQATEAKPNRLFVQARRIIDHEQD